MWLCGEERGKGLTERELGKGNEKGDNRGAGVIKEENWVVDN